MWFTTRVFVLFVESFDGVSNYVGCRATRKPPAVSNTVSLRIYGLSTHVKYDMKTTI